MVHQYQLNGYNIVLDSCSGSVHVVDDVAYDVIAMYKEHSADEIVAAMLAKYADRPDVTEADLRQCLEDVASLEAAGKLWAPDVYKDMAFDFKNRQTVVKALLVRSRVAIVLIRSIVENLSKLQSFAYSSLYTVLSLCMITRCADSVKISRVGFYPSG